MVTIPVDADAYNAMRAVAVGGDRWTHQPEPDGTYLLELDDDIAEFLTRTAAATRSTPSDVIRARIRHGLN